MAYESPARRAGTLALLPVPIQAAHGDPGGMVFNGIARGLRFPFHAAIF